MLKQITRTERVCDICGKWCYSSCLGGCGADYCYSHQKELGIIYRYSVYYQGHGDGYYCHECDKRLRASDDDPLHTAYLKMQGFKEENDNFYKDFDEREQELSLHIKFLYENFYSHQR